MGLSCSKCCCQEEEQRVEQKLDRNRKTKVAHGHGHLTDQQRFNLLQEVSSDKSKMDKVVKIQAHTKGHLSRK